MNTPRHVVVALTVLVAVSLASRDALADDPPASDGASDAAPVAVPAAAIAPQAAPAAKTEWYGHQTLATDALGFGVGALAPSSGVGFAYAGLATYLLGAPIVHVAHGNVAKGFGDLGLRASIPVAGAFMGALIGAATGSRDDAVDATTQMFQGAAIGVLAGVATAITIDAAVLARKEVSPSREREREPAPLPRTAVVRILPSFAPTQGGATGGVVGVF